MFAPNLPGNASVWIYQSSRKFSPEETAAITKLVKNFVSNWQSHKMDVTADGTLLNNLFVIFAVDEEAVTLGGCSIDSSVHFIKSLQEQFSVSFFDRFTVAYKNNNSIEVATVSEFNELLDRGLVNGETIIFNNLVRDLNDFRLKWEIPYKDSWLKKSGKLITPADLTL